MNVYVNITENLKYLTKHEIILQLWTSRRIIVGIKNDKTLIVYGLAPNMTEYYYLYSVLVT